MNNKLRKILLMALTFAVFTISVSSQITGSKSGLINLPTDDSNVEKKVALVTNDAGRYFKQGLLNLLGNQRSLARDNFDKSVEVFLNSSLDVRKNQTLLGCYSQLVETVYLMEFPTSRQPANLRGLATTCGWEIRNETIDAVAKRLVSRNNPTADNLLFASVVTNSSQRDVQVGFSDQSFESVGTDELSLPTSYKIPRQPKKQNTVITSVQQIPKYKIVKNSESKDIAGTKPQQKANGEVAAVMNWFQNNLNDPYSMKIVNWGKVVKSGLGTEAYWAVMVKIRAKNQYGAYILSQYIFFIRQNKIVRYLVS